MQSSSHHGREANLRSSATLTIASLNLHCGVGLQGQLFDVTAAVRALDAAVICLQEAWVPSRVPHDRVPHDLAAHEPAAHDPVLPDAVPPELVPPADEVAGAARLLGATLYRVPQKSPVNRADFGLRRMAGAALSVADASAEVARAEGRPTPGTRVAGHPYPGTPTSGNAEAGQLCLAVLSTLPVEHYEIWELGQAPCDDIPRLAQVIVVRLASGPVVRIVNTHLTHRLTSPVQLERLRRRLHAQPSPTIVAGDLNMPRLIAGRLAGYAPSVRGRTWPAWQPLVQLDHLLISQKIVTVNGAVLAPAGSDHLPVRAAIRLPDSI